MNTPKDTEAEGPLLPGTESPRSLGDLMREAAAEAGSGEAGSTDAVSYTHLTLPTIYSV